VDRINDHEFLFTKVNRGLEHLISGVLARSGKMPPLQCALPEPGAKREEP
jgi:hypothetical protein